MSKRRLDPRKRPTLTAQQRRDVYPTPDAVKAVDKTLTDEFAGQIASALINGDARQSEAWVAERAYAYADALMQERAKR
jgi:hypothetical protein